MAKYGRLAALALALSAAAQGGLRVAGRVTNDSGVPIAGARVWLEPDTRPPKLVATSDPAGNFEISVPAPGDYTIHAEREGFFRVVNRPLRIETDIGEIAIALTPLQEVTESIDVSASPPTIDPDTTEQQQTLTGTQILNVPYPNTNSVQNAMRVLPGMVQDSRGALHLNGGAPEQVYYTLDGFNVADPLTNRFESRVAVEAVQSIQVMSGRYGAEFGKGSAGTVAIRTVTGGDRFRYTATNFVPGIENRKGLLIGNWTPRAHISGPLQRGRAWFSNTFDTQYDKHVVEELPSGQDRTSSWRFSNLLHSQVNLSPRNILQGGMLTNFWIAPRTGLSPLDPRETTVDRRSRQWFLHLKDQIYFNSGMLLEVGGAFNSTFHREIPQGQDFYLFTSEGKRGNFYVDALRKANREQAIINLFLPAATWFGEHRIKVGGDANRLRYSQDVRRTGYEMFRADNTPLRRVEFRGSGALNRGNVEAAWYLQDSWKVRPGLLFELGLRSDWDGLLERRNVSPRTGFAWSPWDNTKIAGGFAVIYDATPLRIFTSPRDQYAVTLYFDPLGSLVRGPAATIFTISDRERQTPRYRNYSMGIEQRLPLGVFMRAQYLRRRGERGLAYFNTLGGDNPLPRPELLGGLEDPAFDGIYDLGNFRRDQYDSVETTFRQPLGRQYEWLVSYTRSRARSNAALDVSIDTPVLASDASGPMAWDAPHRLLSWGYLPTPFRNWAVAYLAEWRSGFPFSIQAEDGHIADGVNSRRFPDFFELNLHLERKLSFAGNRWALRMGFNNITGRENPTVVNNVIGSPNFLTFYGGRSRSLNFRIRWLGKT